MTIKEKLLEMNIDDAIKYIINHGIDACGGCKDSDNGRRCKECNEQWWDEDWKEQSQAPLSH